MPAFAPTFTGRLRVRYRALFRNHVQTWRLPGGAGPTEVSALIALLNDFYAALAPCMSDDWLLISTELSQPDSPIFLPTTDVTIPAGAIAADTLSIDKKAVAISFVGRTGGGNPWKMFQYGFDSSPGADAAAGDFRLLRTEDTCIDNAIVVLLAGLGNFVGNDGTAVSVYPYVNIKANDHYVKLARLGR